MEDSGEQPPKPPDREGLCYAVGRILGAGHVLTNADIQGLAVHYNARPGGIPDLLNTRLAQRVMQEIGVMPKREDHRAVKIWVDGKSGPRPEELQAKRDAIDAKRRKKVS